MLSLGGDLVLQYPHTGPAEVMAKLNNPIKKVPRKPVSLLDDDPSTDELKRQALFKGRHFYSVIFQSLIFIWQNTRPANSFFKITTKHKIGKAIFHPGDFIHESTNLSSGERWNLIGSYFNFGQLILIY